MTPHLRLIAVAGLLPIAAGAQQMVSMQTSGDVATITVRVREQGFTTFSGAPYSARRITTGTQTRPDGTHVSQDRTAIFYRDSAGRNRTEQQVALRSPYMVTIMDPLLGCEYVLDPGHKIAHKLIGVHVGTRPVPQAMLDAARTAAGVAPATASAPNVAVGHTEDLGTRTIQGLTAYGTRVTTTYPPGTHQGNDHIVTSEQEEWIAPSLGNVVVSSRTVEPGVLDTTYTLADVVVGEPNARLFAPPPDYRIVEESSDFKIEVPRDPASTVTKLSSHGVTAATISSAPFSGTRRASGVQILADGTRIERPEQTTFSAWRDSQGRVRTEWPPRGNVPGGVEIKDPTSGFVYNLDYVNQVAYRTALTAEAGVAPKPAEAGMAPKPVEAGYEVASSPLGTQVVLGVPANGVRTTTTGKSEARPKVTEVWTAQTEGIVLVEKITTATEESTVSLKNFSTKEPDPSLFQVPSTYRILDEYGNEIQTRR